MEDFGCRECEKYGSCVKVSFLRQNEPRGREAKDKREIFYRRLAKKCRNGELDGRDSESDSRV